MNIVNVGEIEEFAGEHRDAAKQARRWRTVAAAAEWRTPHDVRSDFSSVDILPGGRLIFNIKQNRYRLVALVNYEVGTLEIRFLGTHKQYDRIDARTV